MKQTRMLFSLIVAACVLTVLAGCTRQRQQPQSTQRPSVNFPVAAGKVWRDTTVHKTVKGLGTFTVTVNEGEIWVDPPPGLKKSHWSLRTERKESTDVALSRKTAIAAAAAGDTDGDGVPDCEDWCMEIPGTSENRGCPPGVEGVPPIRWIELLRMTEGGDEIIIEYGLEECVEE